MPKHDKQRLRHNDRQGACCIQRAARGNEPQCGKERRYHVRNVLAFGAGAALMLAREETHVGDAFADDHRVGIGEGATVDIDDKVSCTQSRERPVDAPQELIVRCPRANRLANRHLDELMHAQRRRQRKGERAARGDGVEIEGHLHADHAGSFCATSRSRLPSGSTVAG